VAELFDQLIIAGALAAGIVYCFFTCRLEGRCMLQFLTSWQVLLAFATLLMGIALLIEPAVPAHPDVQFIEVAELTF
jgi:hypothetical protein